MCKLMWAAWRGGSNRDLTKTLSNESESDQTSHTESSKGNSEIPRSLSKTTTNSPRHRNHGGLEPWPAYGY